MPFLLVSLLVLFAIIFLVVLVRLGTTREPKFITNDTPPSYINVSIPSAVSAE